MTKPLDWERRMITLSKVNRTLQQLNVITDLTYSLARSAISLSAIGVGFAHDRAERKEWDKAKDEVLHPDAVGDLVRRNLAANAKVVFRPSDHDEVAME